MEEEKAFISPILVQKLQDQIKQLWSVDLQIQFDEQFPLSLENYFITVNKPLINSNQPQPHTANEPSIQITNFSTHQAQKHSLKEQEKLILSVPFSSILCLGKKSQNKTLLMLKDKDKIIERDEHGYELVSDDEENQEFEQKQNKLYQFIKNTIAQQEHRKKQPHLSDSAQLVSIKVEQKCNIVLTVNRKHPNLDFISSEQSQKSAPSDLYKFLLDELEEFESKLQINNQNSWRNNLTDAFVMGSGQNNAEQDQEQGYESDNQYPEHVEMQEEQSQKKG